jgi:hypothetical protein
MISSKHYQESCDKLKKFMNKFVPPLMANMFTAAFVRPTNQRYKKLKNCHSLQEQLRQNGSLIL